MESLIKSNGVATVDQLILNLEKKKELAQIFMKSGLIPTALNTPEKVLVCIFKAQELNLPPLEGLTGMAVINGKTTLQGNLILALINRSNKAKYIRIDEEKDSCTVSMGRRDYELEYTFSFSMEDAKKADLLKKDIWVKYPKTMLKWRAVSGCARVVFSDVIGGLYTPEEMILDNSVKADVDEEGNVIIKEVPVEKKETQPKEVIEDAKIIEPVNETPKETQQPKDRNYTDEASKCKTIEQVNDWFNNKLTPEEQKLYKNLAKERAREIKVKEQLQKDAELEALPVALKLLSQGKNWNEVVYTNNRIFIDDIEIKFTNNSLKEFQSKYNELYKKKILTIQDKLNLPKEKFTLARIQEIDTELMTIENLDERKKYFNMLKSRLEFLELDYEIEAVLF